MMTRLKYLFGALLVLAGVGALALNLNQRISTVQDVSATVKSRQYTVGSSYSGVIVHENVQVGDTVQRGDRMFVVKSEQLGRDVAHHAVHPKKAPFDIRHGDELVVHATAPGKVVAVPHVKGAFVGVDAMLARVQVRGSSYVQADFHLSAKEYARIRHVRRVTVTLPNQRSFPATIAKISVRTKGRTADTRLRATTSELTNRGLFATGTPVQVHARLPGHNLLDTARNAVDGLLTPGAT